MKFFICSLFVLAFSGVMAQNIDDAEHFNCGKNTFTEAFFDAHPSESEIAAEATVLLNQQTRNYEKAQFKDDNVLIIPVVFHVIHNNGSENISNEQIQSAIEVLNEDYNASNPNISQVISQFQSIVANVKFEFRLAKKDPNGNCTNGIVRTLSTQTYEGGDDLKQLSPTWGRNKYLNIWVCRTIGDGVAGYAYLPGNVAGGFGAQIDGIVIQHDYVGRIGTGSPAYSHSLSHEVGHWANLEHPWGPSNNPGLASNCNLDDGVGDTPNTKGWTTCELLGTSCGSLDNVQNFMEYSYCSEMFTQGQKTRMRATMNSSIAGRNQLWSNQNLIATGVLDADVVCQAQFHVDQSTFVCAGQEVTFLDDSFNGPTSWNWTFEGGTPATSTEQNPTVTFNTPGLHTVSLTASNPNGSATGTRVDYISVMEPGDGILPVQEGFENFVSLPQYDWNFLNPDNTSIRWKVASDVGYSGNKSLYVRGRLNNNNAVEILESPPFDLSSLSDEAVLTFKYAHAKRASISADRMKVFISRNCGQNWNVREDLQIADLPTVPGTVSGEFIPQSQADWDEISIDVLTSFFLTEQFRFKIEFTSYVGNNLYIDNINIYDPNASGLEDMDLMTYLKVYPNPARSQAHIEFNLLEAADLNIRMVDITGRTVVEPIQERSAPGRQTVLLDVQTLSPGIYFVQLESRGERAVRKLVIQN